MSNEHTGPRRSRVKHGRRTATAVAVAGAIAASMAIAAAGSAEAGPRPADPIETQPTLPPGLDTFPLESLPPLPEETGPPPPSTIALPPLELQTVATLPNIAAREAFSIGDKVFLSSNLADTAGQLTVLDTAGTVIRTITFGESDKVSESVLVGGDRYVMVDQVDAEGATQCVLRKIVPAALDAGPPITFVAQSNCTVAYADPTRPGHVFGARIVADDEDEALAAASVVDLDLTTGQIAETDFQGAIPPGYGLGDMYVVDGATIIDLNAPLDDSGEAVPDTVTGKPMTNRLVKVVTGSPVQTLEYTGQAYSLDGVVYVRTDAEGTSLQLDPAAFTLNPMPGKSPEPKGEVTAGDNAFTSSVEDRTVVVVQHRLSTDTDVARGFAPVEGPGLSAVTTTMVVVGSDVYVFASSSGFDDETGGEVASTTLLKVIPAA